MCADRWRRSSGGEMAGEGKTLGGIGVQRRRQRRGKPQVRAQIAGHQYVSTGRSDTSDLQLDQPVHGGPRGYAEEPVEPTDQPPGGVATGPAQGRRGHAVRNGRTDKSEKDFVGMGRWSRVRGHAKEISQHRRGKQTETPSQVCHLHRETIF